MKLNLYFKVQLNYYTVLDRYLGRAKKQSGRAEHCKEVGNLG